MSAAGQPVGAAQAIQAARVGTVVPIQAVQAPVRQLNLGQQPVHRGAEAAPAVKRYKKRKLPDRYVFQKVARAIPESQLYTTLVRYEQRLDNILASKKAHLQDSLGQPTYQPKVLRLYVYNTHANQQQQQPGPEPPSWCLVLYGRVLDTSDFRPQNATSMGGFPLAVAKQPTFTSVVKRVEVTLEQPRGVQSSVVWEKSRHVGEHKDCLEFRRAGSEAASVQIKIDMDWTPQRYKLPQPLAEMLGMQYNTRPRVLQALWNYIKSQGLVSASDPSRIECDDNLQAVFSQRQLAVSTITERVVAILTPMPPVIVDYTLQVSGDSPSAPQCYDINFELSAPALHHTAYAPFLERINKDREVEQVEQRIAASEAKVAEHRRRRAFFLGFSQAPVEFISALIASQARDLRVAQNAQNREFEAEQPSSVFRERWVEDAVMRYLNRKMAAGR